MILKKAFFRKLQKEYETYEAERREVIKVAGDALARSKQAIFAFHRDDRQAGERLLVEARAFQQQLKARFARTPGLVWEGSYRAMLEEYVEAMLYAAFLRGESVDAVDALGVDADAYLGGLADFTGELVRRAVTEATRHNTVEVHRCHATVTAVVAELVQINIVGPLRPKYDQAKTNLRKLEEILYDLSLRGR
jgi:predicted translin family RNA/ssDNA-binding protein